MEVKSIWPACSIGRSPVTAEHLQRCSITNGHLAHQWEKVVGVIAEGLLLGGGGGGGAGSLPMIDFLLRRLSFSH